MAKIILDFEVNKTGLPEAEASLRQIENLTEKDRVKFSQLNNEIDRTGKEVKEIEKNTKNLNTQFGEVQSGLKKIALTVGIAFGIEQIKNFGKAAVNAFLEAELNARKLFVATGGIERNYQKLLKQSAELQSKSIFSDDDIQQAQTIALQYGLTADQVERLTPLIADFASATGQDLAGAYEKVISGLEGNTRGLKLYGIRLKEGATQSEKLAQITDQLTDKFKGQAEVITQEGIGKIKQFQNEVGDALEVIGESFVNIFEAAITASTSDTNFIQQYFIDRGVESALAFSKGVRAGLQDKFIKEIEGLSKTDLQKRLDLTLKAIDFADSEQTKRNLQDRVIILEQYLKETESQTKEAADRVKQSDISLIKQLTINDDNLPEFLQSYQELLEEYEKGLTNLKFFSIKTNKEQLDDAIDSQKKANEERVKSNKEAEDQILKDTKLTDEEIRRINRERQAFISSIILEGLSFANIAYEEESQQLKDQLERRAISQEEYDRRVKRLKQEQAESDKRQQIFSIILSGITAVQNALATIPSPNIPLAVLAGSLSAIQLSKAIATPIPKFAKGIEFLKGQGSGTSDSNLAWLSHGERVVPAHLNRDYYPTLTAIHNKRVKAKDINDFVLNGGVKATIDEYALARLINRNRSVTVTNLGELSKLFNQNARRV